MAHVNDLLALRDGSSILLLRNGVDGLLLDFGVINVGSSISGGVFSRGRWRSMVDEEERIRQEAIDQRERKRTRRIEARKKAKADAEAARKAKIQADYAAMVAQHKAASEGLRGAAAQSANTIAGTLENLRVAAIAADSARQREQARKEAEAEPKLTMIQTIMKRNKEKYGL